MRMERGRGDWVDGREKKHKIQGEFNNIPKSKFYFPLELGTWECYVNMYVFYLSSKLKNIYQKVVMAI